MSDVRKPPLVAVGAGVAAVSFFLPFVKSPSLFGLQISRSGVEVGGMLWLAMLAALGILAAQYLLSGPSASARRPVTLAASGLGIMVLFYAGAGLFRKSGLLELSPWNMGFRPSIGAVGCMVGLVIAFEAAFLQEQAIGERYEASSHTP